MTSIPYVAWYMDNIAALLSTLSHELRHPVSMAIQLSQLLQQEYCGELAPQQAAIVERILQQNRYLLARLDTCLEIAQLETGQLGLFPVCINLEQLLPGILLQVKSSAFNGVPTFILTWEIEDTKVVCDRVHLHQFLASFLHQVVKPMPSGTFNLKITDLPCHWSLSILLPAKYPQQQLTFFQDFQASGLTLQHLANGPALELALVNALARKMDGTIQFQHGAEQSDSIQVTLPKF